MSRTFESDSTGMLSFSIQQVYIPEWRKQRIVERVEFWEQVWISGFIFSIAGAVFFGAMFMQYFSIVLTSDSVTPLWFIFSIVLSTLALLGVRSIIPAEKHLIHSRGGEEYTLDLDFPHNVTLPLAFLSVSIGMLYFSYVSVVTLESLPSLKEALANLLSKGDFVTFSMILIVYLVLVGTVVTGLAGLRLILYRGYRWRISLKIWFRRLLAYSAMTALYTLRGESMSRSDFLKPRCNQCMAKKFELRFEEDDRVLVCSYCGLEKLRF